jgi:hypothetical protein
LDQLRENNKREVELRRKRGKKKGRGNKIAKN